MWERGRAFCANAVHMDVIGGLTPITCDNFGFVYVVMRLNSILMSSTLLRSNTLQQRAAINQLGKGALSWGTNPSRSPGAEARGDGFTDVPLPLARLRCSLPSTVRGTYLVLEAPQSR
eukprot:5284081-Prymnesium_polylepis.1